MKKFKEIWDACTIKFPMWFRITIVGTFIVIITLAITLPLVLKNKQDEVIINAPIGKKYLQLNIIINKTKSGNSHTLDNNDDFFLSNYYGYEKFKKIKPIDDFSWIGLDINAIGTYKIVLSFEMNENWLLEEKLVFLELDFFVGPNSKSILLRSA